MKPSKPLTLSIFLYFSFCCSPLKSKASSFCSNWLRPPLHGGVANIAISSNAGMFAQYNGWDGRQCLVACRWQLIRVEMYFFSREDSSAPMYVHV
jgi:hypothetical protein